MHPPPIELREEREGVDTSLRAAVVSHTAHIPLYVQIEEELRGLIEAGELPPFSQVLSEVELAKRFGVSRMTARKAIDGLVGAGVLFRRVGKGTFVAAPKIARSVFSTQHSFPAAMEALGLRHSTRVLERRLVPAPRLVAHALQLPTAAVVVYIRRLRIVENEPAALHVAYLPSSYADVLDSDLTQSLSERLLAMGMQIAETQDSVEAVLAKGEDAVLLGIPENSPLIHIEGTTYLADGSPSQYTEALFRGDRFRLMLGSNRLPGGEIHIRTEPRTAVGAMGMEIQREGRVSFISPPH